MEEVYVREYKTTLRKAGFSILMIVKFKKKAAFHFLNEILNILYVVIYVIV